MTHFLSQMLKIATLGSLIVLSACGETGNNENTSNGSDADKRAEQLYYQSCFACHNSGAGGAPRKGDTKTWQTKLDAKGMETLLDNTEQGIRGMPPRGLCRDCSREDFAALIEWMAR